MRSNPCKYWRGLMALGLGLLAAAGPAAAQEDRVSTTAARPAEPPTLDIRDNAVQLSVERAVEVALQQNLGIVIERYVRTQRRLAITQALGLYDLLAQADVSASETRRPSGISQIEGTESSQQAFNFSFRQRIPTGGDVAFGWNNSRFEGDSPLRADLTYSSGFQFTYNQPLLRDFGRLATERNILVARTGSQLSRQEFERRVVETIQDVVNAYWNLVGARQQLVVAQESLGLARELHERNRIQVEVGTMAPLEMVQSEAAIATREESIIRATSSIGDAEDQLRRLLNLPTVGGLWETPILPTTPPEAERVTIDVEEAIRTAFAERPELRTQALQLEQARLDAQFFRNQLKPALDLNVDYGYTGASTPIVDPVTGRVLQTADFGTALEQALGLDFRGWSAALVFSYPLQNRTARAQSAIANLDVERLQTQLDEQRTLIATEVRRAARAVETAAKQIEAARVSRQFQERNLEAERKRYENGMSTSFQITEIQEDVTQARSNEVTATINYRTALAEYYRATGRLLEQQGVAIDDPEEPDFASQRFSFSRAPLPGEDRYPDVEP